MARYRPKRGRVHVAAGRASFSRHSCVEQSASIMTNSTRRLSTLQPNRSAIVRTSFDKIY